MALNAYLRLKGAKSGEIQGSCLQKGREGLIVVIASSHEVHAARDATLGLATGQRLHKPFVITKEVDRASPLLYQALVNNETLPEFELQFWSVNLGGRAGSGMECQHYSVRLTNAQISDIRFTQPKTRDEALARCAEFEDIAFTYQRIEWLWVEDGLTAQDDW